MTSARLANMQTIPLDGKTVPWRRPKWCVGVTTVSERADDLLPRTLKSVTEAGFTVDRLFVDGSGRNCSIPTTYHVPPLRTAGNWVLALTELYIRCPDADRYAVFQDDLVLCRNVKQYLDNVVMTEKCYWNLYCAFENDEYLANKDAGFYPGVPYFPGATVEGPDGKLVTGQKGRSALALVFSREGVVTLLSQRRFVERHQSPTRGWRAIDGGIVDAMNGAGWQEHVHYPSLAQHTGLQSSMGNHPHPLSKSFLGEEYDAMAGSSKIGVEK